MAIQSVDRALRILLALQEERLLGVSELSTRLGMAKGTIHGLLRTMADRAVVEQDSASGKYRLGPALLLMGNVFLDSHDLRVRSLPYIASLNRNTGLAVRVGVLVWPEVVLVAHHAAADAALPISEVGLGLPAHATCAGKVILAFHPRRAELLGQDPLPRLTGATITAPATLQGEWEEIRASGIAYEDQEAVVGEGGVAAAVFSVGGEVLGSVSVVYPSLEVAPPPPGAVAAIRDTARALSRELGAPVWPSLL